MVKFTLIGRLTDGLPLAKTAEYIDEKDKVSFSQKKQAELIILEIANRDLTDMKVTLVADHYNFLCLITARYCYITLCGKAYPQKLAFYYLWDISKEFEKADAKLLDSFTTPYTFKRFDFIIEKIRKRYLDPRSQARLSKLNGDRGKDLDVVVEELSRVINNAQTSIPRWWIPEVFNQKKQSIWRSKHLEVIALKWTPIIVSAGAIAALLWAGNAMPGYCLLGAL